MTQFIGSTFAQHATSHPEALALLCGHDTLNWRDLHDAVERLASVIAAHTPAQGSVALTFDNNVTQLAGLLATARAGRRAMVFDAAWPRPLHDTVMAACTPDFVLPHAASINELIAALGGDSTAIASPPLPDASLAFYVGFTSGSSGVPKGYERSHASWLSSFDFSAAEFAINAQDRILAPGGLVHSLHLYGAVHALHCGAQTHIMASFRPRSALERITAHAITVLYATPTQIDMLIASALASNTVCPSVRYILIGGAKWDETTHAALSTIFPAAEVCEFYGASETSFITLSRRRDHPPAGSVGRAVHGVEIEIRDDEGTPQPSGESGTIWVRSAMLFDRYVCGGETSETQRNGAWLSIGDTGWLDAQGFLFLNGRRTRMLVSSGVNVYAEEIERALRTCDSVRDAAAFGLTDTRRGQRIVAAIMPTDPALPPPTDSLLKHCRDTLSAAKSPKHFHIITDWPLTPGGKTDLVRLQGIIETLDGAP